MMKTKKRSVCLPKRSPLVFSDTDSDSGTVDTVASVVEQPDKALSQETSDTKKRLAKKMMSAERENVELTGFVKLFVFTRKGSVTTRTLRRGVACAQKRQLKLK